jgi:uncharacterized protein DUF4838/glycosyl hydrolase family 67
MDDTRIWFGERVMKGTVSVWLGLVLISSVAAGEIRLSEDGRSEYVIVLPAKPTIVEETAGRELQEHLEKVTGAKLPVVGEEAELQGKPIFVGPSLRAIDLLGDIEVDELGHDGIVIRTVGDSLVLLGDAPRGTLYAVFTFLEDVVGVRWWTPIESFLPKKPTLRIPELDVCHTPKLQFREAFYRDAFEGVFASRSKCNGHFPQVSAEYGGHYPILGWCHTFFRLLPPEKYFAKHPEWYSEIDGERRDGRTQLCLTNDAMRAELVEQALQWLRAASNPGVIDISQNDWHGRCQCEKCLAIEEKEGSPAGPLLHFLNAVAEEIEKEFPDVKVMTLAYQYTRTPPKYVRPRHNVVIRLCSIECSFVETLAEGEQNETFRRDIEGWSQIADQLYVWDYVTNFSHYILPHPNLRVLGPNIRYFVEHNTIGLFEQGDSSSGIGDFVRMRAWVLSHLMWDHERDGNALIDEFLAGYYGPAAPHLKAYLDTLHNGAEESDVYLRCFMPDTSKWLTLETLNEGTRHFGKAMAAVSDDPVLAARVRRERLPLDHVWLQRYRAFKRQAAHEGKEFLGPADPVAACDEFLRLAAKHHAGSFREGQPFGPYGESLRRRYRKPGPPPMACRDLAEDQWGDVQDNEFRFSSYGTWVKTVEDALASDGMAARMPGNHPQWAVQFPVPHDYADGEKWQCFAEVRAEGKAEQGTAMVLGIYDAEAKKGLAQRRLTMDEAVGGKYHTVDLGVHQLTGDCYLWAAPPNRPDEVDAVYVDRFYFVRQGGKAPANQ